MVKTKKNEMTINGNTIVQNFDDLRFVKDYLKWKNTVTGISGDSMGVKNIPTLWDFLDTHIFDNIREESVNAGKDGEGVTKVLTAIEGIMEDRQFLQADYEDLVEAYNALREMEDNKTSGMKLDPKLIVFTEKTYDASGQVSGETDLLGHYRTDEYVKRREKNPKNEGELPAVDSGWYSGTGNPPSFALFSKTSTPWSEPKGLVYILEDLVNQFSPKKKGSTDGPTALEAKVAELRGKGAENKLAGIASVERYFNKAINNTAFWKGGKLLVGKLQADIQSQEFKATVKESSAVKAAMGFPKDKMPIGTIKTFKIEITGTPLIRFIQAALQRANKNKGADGYRAWTSGGQFDYRKTRREKFGKDTKSPDKKVISKQWREILER